MTNEEIRARFSAVAVDDETRGRMDEITEGFIRLATLIDDLAHDGRCKSISFTNLEAAKMYAIRAAAGEGR